MAALGEDGWRGNRPFHDRIEHLIDQASGNSGLAKKTQYKDWGKAGGLDTKEYKEDGPSPKESRDRETMEYTTRKSGKRKKNEDGELMKHGGAPARAKRNRNGKPGRRNSKRRKCPRRTECSAKARTRTRDMRRKRNRRSRK